MVIDFSKIDYTRRPTLVLKNASGKRLGVLGATSNLSLDIQYNETSTLEFTVFEKQDGVPTRHYGDVVGMRIIELPGIGQFMLMNPKESGDGIYKQKQCKAYSLEYEWTRKKITIAEGTFKFWDDADPTNTMLGMMMEMVPNWTVGYVSPTLFTKYRTFEATNENLYNFAKGEVQESYSCLFYYDTLNRIVHIRDLNEDPATARVFLSHRNLISNIEIEENTEDVVTRLDVSGADGVDIRDVNPCGTNKITRLGYYMTPSNAPQELIDKYAAWEALVENNRQTYYTLNLQYALLVEQKTAESAALTDLEGEMASLENIQAVIMQAIAQGIRTQGDLDDANANIEAKQREIDAQKALIDSIETDIEDAFLDIQEIVRTCSYESYFTEEELRILDTYIKDDEVSESTFVASESQSYTDEYISTSMADTTITFLGDVTPIQNGLGTTMYKVVGGQVLLNDGFTADVVSAVIEVRTDGEFILSSHLVNVTRDETEFPTGCLTLTGDGAECTADGNSVTLHTDASQMYFTLNAGEYERRSVAWDLYEYGRETIDRISKPGYTFDLTCANFLSLEEFRRFRDDLVLGDRVYVERDVLTFTSDESKATSGPLRPIFISARIDFENPNELTMKFSDSYVSGDSQFRLVNLLDKSVSMGKKLDLSKYTYSAFSDSGANTSIKEFITSSFDVSKNAITSSSGQSPSVDGTGIRLRKWANQDRTAYEDEQIWMNNNSIMMTRDNWKTAQMAIGKFHDDTLGECWGIVAERIAGTLIAGSSLAIESAKQDGGISVFRVDGEGAKLYNADISVRGDNKHITMNPNLGLVIGAYPAYKTDTSGKAVIDEENAKFWVDTTGNVHMKGTLHGVDGEFNGAIMIRGSDGSYFRADANAMGFYDVNNTPLLIQQGGALSVTASVDSNGALTAGQWLYNLNGMRYTHPTTAGSYFRISSTGSSAYCSANGMNMEYGTSTGNTTFIRGRDTIIAAGTAGGQVRIGCNTSDYATGSTDVSIYCLNSTGSTTASGNVGTSTKPWNYVYCNTVQRVNEASWSSRTVKQDITELGDVGDVIDRLTPVSFAYKAIPDKTRFGLIYEDTIDVLPEICLPARSEADVPSIDYTDLIPILLKEVQSLRNRVSELEAGQQA